MLITYFLWSSVYAGSNQHNLFGYTQPQMLTYIILFSIVGSITQTTKTYLIGYDINFGKLSSHLLKPYSYFTFNIFRDLGDKLINTLFSVSEICILVLLLKIPLVIQPGIFTWIPFIISILVSSVLYFEINSLLALIGFWSRDTWAPRFVFYTIVAFLSGSYFPLDILPQPLFKVLELTPFPYLVYYPVKMYLFGDRYGFGVIFRNLLINFSWILLLFLVIRKVWRSGLRVYTSEGV